MEPTQPNAISTQGTNSDRKENNFAHKWVICQYILKEEKKELNNQSSENMQFKTLHALSVNFRNQLEKLKLIPLEKLFCHNVWGIEFCPVWNCKNFRHPHFPSNIIHKVHHMWTMSKDKICEILKCSIFIYPIYITSNLSHWINCLNIEPCW